MNLEAQKTVACSSRKQADLYIQKGNVGRAFAHLLVALKLSPHWKSELKDRFSSTLCNIICKCFLVLQNISIK